MIHLNERGKMNTMVKKTNNTVISKSLIFAWAILLVFVLGILVWIAIWPEENYVDEDIAPAIDLELPEPVPMDEFIIPDEEMQIDRDSAHKPTTPDEHPSTTAYLAGGPLLKESQQGFEETTAGLSTSVLEEQKEVTS